MDMSFTETLEDLFPGFWPDKVIQNLFLSPATTRRLPPAVLAEDVKVLAFNLGHNYSDTARYDVVELHASKRTFRRLGLLLLSTLFQPAEGVVTVYLSHPDTRVTEMEIATFGPSIASGERFGLVTTPCSFGYEPRPVHRLHPLASERWAHDRRCPGPSAGAPSRG